MESVLHTLRLNYSLHCLKDRSFERFTAKSISSGTLLISSIDLCKEHCYPRN